MKTIFAFAVLSAILFATTQLMPVARGAVSCGSSFLKLTPNAKNKAKGYPDPKLSVNCSSSTMTVTSNNIPNFEFVQTTPNVLREQNLQIELPLKPVLASSWLGRGRSVQIALRVK